MSKIENSPTRRQIAVSGSTGLIGAALCRQLIADGHRVRPIVRGGQGAAAKDSATSEDIQWDPAQGLLDPAQLVGIDCIVHLAGHNIASSRWTSEEKQRIRDSRVAATRRLVEQIRQLDSPPPTFVSASAIGIYGNSGRHIVDEATPAAGEFLANVASDWEDACLPLQSAGIRVAHPRFGIVLAADGGALAKMLPLFRKWLGGRLGSGEQYWSWVALEDCVRALLWLIDTPSASGAFNVVSPRSVTNAQFTAALARALGVKAVIPAPAWALRLALGEMADALLLCSCRAIPRRLMEAGFTFAHPQLEPLLRDVVNLRH